MNPHISHPQLDLAMFDAQVDIISAWSTVDHAFDNYFSRPDSGDLIKAFIQWNQLKQVLVDRGLGRVLSSYESTLQKNLILWVAKTREEHMPEVLSTISAYGVVEPEMIMSLTKKGLDCIDIEAEAVNNMLKHKTHLINTSDRDANHELMLLIDCYLMEPQENIVLTIFDDILKNSNDANFLMTACLSMPIQDHRVKLGKDFKSWLIDNDTALAHKLVGTLSTEISDSVVHYLHKAGANETATLLFERINKINSPKKTLHLVNNLDRPLSEHSISRLSRKSPDELMMYFILKPDYLCKSFSINKDIDNIDFDKSFSRAIAKLKHMKIPYDHKEAGSTVDIFNPSRKTCEKTYQLLATSGEDRDLIAAQSNLMKRIRLESDFSL